MNEVVFITGVAASSVSVISSAWWVGRKALRVVRQLERIVSFLKALPPTVADHSRELADHERRLVLIEGGKR